MNRARFALSLALLLLGGCARPSAPPAGAPTEREQVEAIRRGRPLPQSAAAWVGAIRRVETLHGHIRFDESGELAGIDLAGGRVSVADADVAALAPLTSLTSLRLSGEQITSAAVETLLRWTKLGELFVQDAQLVDADLARLAALQHLRVLTLRRCGRLTDAGLEHLARWPALAQVYLPDGQFGDRAVAALARVPKLTAVDLRECPAITEAGLKQLAGIKQLSVVRLGGATITDDVLGVLGRMTLRRVTLDGAAITDAGLQALAGQDLEEIGLSRCLGLSDEGLKLLSGWKNLQSVALRDVPVTAAGLAPLAACPHLTSLSLEELLVGDAGLSPVAGLKNLRRLELRQIGLTGAALPQLTGLTRLKWLSLAENQVAGGLESLAPLAGLESLDLSANSELGGVALGPLAKLTALRTLYLTQTAVTRDGLQRLAQALPGCHIESSLAE